MIYDVHIGKLISGRRELEGKGVYLLCTTDRKIQEIPTFSPEDGVFVSREDMENALYDFCKSALSTYIDEGRNKDVYSFSIYTDSYYGSYVIYINNCSSLDQTVDTYYASYQEKYMKTNDEFYNRTRDQVLNSLKFAEGDYPFMFEEMPDYLEKYLNIFACIEQEAPGYLNIEQNYIFEKSIIDSELFLIAINVIHRLQDDLKQLDQTEDFIAYVSAADGVGGDYLTLSQLIRRCVPEDQLYKAMHDLKEKDSEFHSTIDAVRQLPVIQQIKYWVNIIEEGEFAEGSMRSFLRTDYEAYEQLVELGEQVIPYIQEFLNGDFKEETRYILQLVIEDLKEQAS